MLPYHPNPLPSCRGGTTVRTAPGPLGPSGAEPPGFGARRRRAARRAGAGSVGSDHGPLTVGGELARLRPRAAIGGQPGPPHRTDGTVPGRSKCTAPPNNPEADSAPPVCDGESLMTSSFSNPSPPPTPPRLPCRGRGHYLHPGF
eukprot:748287-Hanusia_phi.AAC.3